MTSTTRPTARRGCAPLGLLLLAACGGAPPVTMSCRVAPATPTPGVPLVAVVTLENVTPETVTILGMSLPWLYRHAAHFASLLLRGPKKNLYLPLPYQLNLTHSALHQKVTQ